MEPPNVPYRVVCCAVDFSDGSRRALDHATALAKVFGATLHLVHVHRVEVLVSPDGGLAIPESALREISDAARRSLERVAESPRAAGVDTVVHALEGSPAEETVALASSLGADVIVVGTHGRTGISRMLLGSVAERIVRTATVPVLTVRIAEG